MDNEREVLLEQFRDVRSRFNETFIGHCYNALDNFAYKVIGQNEKGNLCVIAICYDNEKPAITYNEEMDEVNPLEDNEISNEQFTKLTKQTLLVLSDAVIKNLKG